MAAELPFIFGQAVSLEDAENSDDNVVNLWEQDKATAQLYIDLWGRRDALESLAKHHLGLNNGHVSITAQSEWKRGSFNICIPKHVNSRQGRTRLIMRCPMPHKLAEARYPGSVDEKMSCEVGAYVWMQNNCADIRIPHLYGFGFSDHRHFTHERQRPWYIRLVHAFRRCLRSILHHPCLSHYTIHSAKGRLPAAYMLLEHVSPEMGQMLSTTWKEHRSNPSRRARLFQSISRLVLSLARIPQPRIGSFQFHPDCTIALTNRPLTCTTMLLENEGAPRAIKETYSCTDSYLADLLTLHDNSFLTCRENAASGSIMQVHKARGIKPELRNGPFVLQFTGFHASNIFVDEDWNVTCLIDLEWICALPAEMLNVPYWLTGCHIDEITDDNFTEFNNVRLEFMKMFEQEQRSMKEKSLALADIMTDMWNSKQVWFWHSVNSVNALRYLADDHIYPMFSINIRKVRPEVDAILSKLWREDSSEVIKTKVADYEQYKEQLQALYQVEGRPHATKKQ